MSTPSLTQLPEGHATVSNTMKRDIDSLGQESGPLVKAAYSGKQLSLGNSGNADNIDTTKDGTMDHVDNAEEPEVEPRLGRVTPELPIVQQLNQPLKKGISLDCYP